MSVSYGSAKKVLDRAIELASQKAARIAVVVVDDAGNVIVSARMDGVGRMVYDLARRKAVTAASLGAPLDKLVENVGGDPVLMNALSRHPELLLLPGATPLPGGGAVGIGGGDYKDDQEIANRCAK
jgi:glc operon protein GlcG